MAAALFGGTDTAKSAGAPAGSTYSTESEGLSAIYQALPTKDVRRFEFPPGRLPSEIDKLVVWDASALSDDSWADLKRWTGEGHTLIVGGESDYLSGSTTAHAGGPAPSAAVHAVTTGVLTVDTGNRAFANLDHAPFVHLTRQDGTPVLISWAEGQGRIFWSADTEWLSNLRIAKADNLSLALNLLTPAKGKEVAFDEYHHGFQAAERWWQILRGPLQIFVIILGAALVLFFWAYGVRFGAPRPLPIGPPRAAVEYVYSMSQLYRRARARTVVLTQIHRWLKREVGKVLGGAGGLSHADLAQRVALQTGLPAEQVQAILDRTAPDRKPEPTETELIALVREAEDLQRRMRNAGYRDQRNP